jgi:predicted PurR-regulated permease PerM
MSEVYICILAILTWVLALVVIRYLHRWFEPQMLKILAFMLGVVLTICAAGIVIGRFLWPQFAPPPAPEPKYITITYEDALGNRCEAEVPIDALRYRAKPPVAPEAKHAESR